MADSFSVIIPSIKPDIATLHSLTSNMDVIVSRKQGIGYARNYGASQARGNLLVFLDDDLTLKPKAWRYIFNVAEGEFGMTYKQEFPCTRIMAIHKADFWRVGGFDSNIKYNGEDRDFYVRALTQGLRHKQIPISTIQHMGHKPRSKNIHVGIRCVRDNARFIVKYWRLCPRKILRVDWFNRLRLGQIRTLLLQLLFTFYFMVKGT